MAGTVRQALAAANGGPGLTVEEIAAQTGKPAAAVRSTLYGLVFEERVATVRPGDRYALGDPRPLLELQTQ